MAARASDSGYRSHRRKGATGMRLTVGIDHIHVGEPNSCKWQHNGLCEENKGIGES